MVFLTLVIGVLNVCLGYALAVHLGYGPPGLLETWEALTAEPLVRRQRTAAGQPVESFVQDLASAQMKQMLDYQPDDMMDRELDVEAYGESDDDAPAEPLASNIPEIWDLNEKYVETSLLKLNIAMMKSGARATEIDTQLRACRGRTDAATIQECLAKLKEDCEAYLLEQSETAERFRDRIDELGELSTLGDEIEMANLEQAAQVETTDSNLAQMDFESDLEAANARLVEEITHLRVARHRLRDNQEAAFLAIARSQNRLGAVVPQLHDDPLTGLYSRIGLETILWEWWQQGRHQSRQMTAALFDLDGFGQINEKHGSLIGDRILHHVGRHIRNATTDADLVARFAGQRFLVLMLDVGPRTGIKNAETIRQSIGEITFFNREKKIRLTTAGGITEVTPDDTHEALFERLEETLRQAKQTGPDRSFFHGGTKPELVRSPILVTEGTEISL